MPSSQRILALDLGEARIGVAVSDPLGLTAQPVGMIRTKSIKDALAQVAALVAQYSPQAVVLGLPINMDGTEGDQAAWVRQFGRRLAGRIAGVEIVYWDERLTSVASDALLADSGLTSRKRREYRDKIAAALILQAYLESRRPRDAR